MRLLSYRNSIEVAVLPTERNARKEVRWHLTRELNLSRNWLKESIAAAKPPITLRTPTDVFGTIKSVLDLYFRACRRSRQIIALCEMGQADGAEVLCRSMFEGYLALKFISRESVRLRRRGSKKPVPTHKKKLTREFRAKLYHAYAAFRRRKMLEGMKTVPGYKRFAKEGLASNKKEIDEWTTLIGADWAKTLEDRYCNTCSGLSIENFAYTLGAYQWYRMIYSMHSNQVHVGESARFVRQLEEDGNATAFWHDEIRDVKGVLYLTTGLLGLSAHEFARFLDPKCKRYQKLRIFDNTKAELDAAFR